MAHNRSRENSGKKRVGEREYENKERNGCKNERLKEIRRERERERKETVS